MSQAGPGSNALALFAEQQIFAIVVLSGHQGYERRRIMAVGFYP
jgi:hypothetical protein